MTLPVAQIHAALLQTGPLCGVLTPSREVAASIKRGYYNRVIMKTLIGSITVGTILVGV